MCVGGGGSKFGANDKRAEKFFRVDAIPKRCELDM